MKPLDSTLPWRVLTNPGVLLCKEARASRGLDGGFTPFGAGEEPLDERPWNDDEIPRGMILSDCAGRLKGIGMGLDAAG